MDEEYAMNYAPLLYNFWRNTTPARRENMNHQVKLVRDMHQAGRTNAQIMAHVMAQPNPWNYPPHILESLVRAVLFAPHVPAQRPPKRAY